MEVDYITQGDSLVLMKALPDNCIDLTVTSPPYDNLRSYNEFTWDFEGIAKQMFRITKDGGVVVWIVGDATIKGSETGSSFKQALFFKECGFNLHDTMIFAKRNPIPQTHKRYEQAFEYMFIFSKGKPKTFNPILEVCKGAGQKRNRKNASEMDKKQCMRVREEETITNAFKRSTNIFYYNVGGGKTGHPAPFPEQLANDHILSWSNEGDIVFDPFLGSGTTAKMAVLNNRHYIGFELSSEYFDIACQRLDDVENGNFFDREVKEAEQ